jgi:hypothetical protein
MDRPVKWGLRIARAIFLSLVLTMPALAVSSSGGRMVYVADSRRFTGWRAWITSVYNESHVYFALLTIVTIPLLSFVLGKLTGAVMARLGINLKSRVLAEH